MEPGLLINGLFAIATFLAAFWIRQMREDFKELVKTVNNHGERIAVLESRMDREG